MSLRKSIHDTTADPLSRRDMLRHCAVGACGLAISPGVLILNGCAPSASTTKAPSADESNDVDYTLRAVKKQAAPDGRSRDILCYNGELPGPVIRAKLGQKLRVRVKNELDVPTSVHWHGQHQPGTWQMDGVANVSRPPIAPGEEFVYEFEATPAGTHWYHSHTGVQYGDGLFGPLIVEDDKPIAPYDREEILLLNDWFAMPAEKILAGLTGSSGGGMAGMKMTTTADGAPAKMPAMKMPTTDSAAKMPEKATDEKAMPPMKSAAMAGMSMAGDGKPDVGDVPFESVLFNGRGRFGADSMTPLPTIDVKPGETLRLRLINGSTTYALRFQIDGHRLTVIASDGAPLEPVEVDNLVINVGERYDVLLRADQRGAALIRVATLAGDEARALLRYPNAAAGEPAVTPVAWGERIYHAAEMRARDPVPVSKKPREIRLRLGGTMSPYAWNINEQTYPQADPISLKADEVVRFVMENPTGMDHPFHLHGHYFSVLGDPDRPNLTSAPKKDTVNIPAGKTVLLEWRATNPGRWFYHCHIEWHAVTGMARVIEIS
ncbi:MAG TPA: multicopper oxidase family protein [Pirellulales bacterium]|jgi:FtsP/CotA-like multicopper oxidase with cupredoxin domain